MYILAIHSGGHDSGAALFNGYELVASVQRERLTRKKGDGYFPKESIEEVLAIGGITAADIGVVALSRNYYPIRYMRLDPLRRAIHSVKRALGGAEEYKDLVTVMHRRKEKDITRIFDREAFLRDLGLNNSTEVFFYNHHFAHALTAFFYTTWDDALVYTADGYGDNVQYSAHIYKDGKLTCLFGDDENLHGKRKVDSIGVAYAFATDAIGFTMNRHEGKLTGLAAFGEPLLYDAWASHFHVDENGVITTDYPSYAAMQEDIRKGAATHAREHVAASVQKLLEEVMFTSVSRLMKKHGVKHLALAGGVFANVRLNRKLCEETGAKEIFIFPAMGDEGLPVGGALHYLLEKDGLSTFLSQRRVIDHVYRGRDFAAQENTILAAQGVETLAGDPAVVTAQLLADGYVGAIYHGRMEYGPRALGARTILASPADRGVNDSINKRLQRTEFMPFAPYVLEEDAARVFDVTPANHNACRFMTITTAVKEEWKTRIAAVVHVDGTARPQIVTDEGTPLYASILRHFKKLTGLPVLVNTSFNVHEEPIINSPQECLRALMDDRVDFIVTTQGVYRKKAQALRKAA